MNYGLTVFRCLLISLVTIAILPASANSQAVELGKGSSLIAPEAFLSQGFDVSSFPAGTFGEDAGPSPAQQPGEQKGGAISRSVKRVLADQRELYLAPFKPANFKWDALVLAGTTGLLIADRHIENALPGGHYTFFQDSSDIAIAGLGAALAGAWIYGIKNDHPHLKEMGDLELESLVDTFLIYTPMQFIAGRQRPGEGNGHGDFLRHHAMNTSFPGGHAMFAWAMATVAAHEYPKPWVEVLAYGAALTVTAGRFLGRDHWSSDMFVGTALGISIGNNIFHSRCDPDVSDSCRRHSKRVKMPAELQSWRQPDSH